MHKDDMKNEEETLQELIDYRTIFEICGSSIAVVEEDTTISLVNTEFVKLFGYTKEEIEGKKKLTDICAPEDKGRVNNYQLQRIMAPASAPQNYEALFVRKDGSYIDIQVFNNLIPGTKKSVLSTIDITRRKKTEEALLRSHEELDSRVKKRTSELEKLNQALLREIEERKRAEAIISRQAQEILEVSTPVIQIWEGIVTVPLIGTLDSMRAEQLMEQLLQKIVETGSSVALLDVTGVPAIDSRTARHLLETINAVRLLGAEVVLTGIRPAIARTLAQLGVDLSNVKTRSSFSTGLLYALNLLKLQVVKQA